MFNKIGIFTCLSFAALGLTSLCANSQTVQQGTQDAYIQGDNNQINQTINQYYFNNPGQGAIKRRKPVIEQNDSWSILSNSNNNNAQPKKSNNREWGHNQGLQRRSSKK